MKPMMNLRIHSIFEVISETSTHSGIKQNLVERKSSNHWFVKRVSREVQIKLGCLLRCPAHCSASLSLSKTTTKQGSSGWGGCVPTCSKQYSQYCTGRKPCGPSAKLLSLCPSCQPQQVFDQRISPRTICFFPFVLSGVRGQEAAKLQT